MSQQYSSFLASLQRHHDAFATVAGLLPQAEQLLAVVQASLAAGGKVVFLGNGGSAADSHIAIIKRQAGATVQPVGLHLVLRKNFQVISRPHGAIDGGRFGCFFCRITSTGQDQGQHNKNT